MESTVRILLPAVLGVCLASCVSQKSHFEDISDLPLKSVRLPSMTWQQSPLRANAQYVLHNAQSGKERRARLGDYYFVDWYDAEPDKPVQIEMLYTQALTTSQRLSAVKRYEKPRSSRGTRKTTFFFNGQERARRGDILTWRMNLYVDGKLMDSRKSFLWKD